MLLLRERIRRLRGVAPTRWRWIAYFALVVGSEMWRLGWRALWRLARKLFGHGALRGFGIAFYWWRMCPKYTTVLDRTAYERRVVLPTLGLD